jgi:hypothetical protein
METDETRCGSVTASANSVLRRTFLVATGALLALAIAASSLAAAPSFTGWSAPLSIGPAINTVDAEGGPALSSDGLSLYFHSTRPGGSGGFDLWVARRATPTSGWGVPVNLGATVNSPALDEAPSLSTDGHWLFFGSGRAGGFGMTDVWASWRSDVHDDLGWQAPVNLGPNVNTALIDSGPVYFANLGGRPQLWFGSERAGGFGLRDFYVSELQAGGPWGPATHLPELSSDRNDARPMLRGDGLEVFFHSDRAGGAGNDLWTSTRASVGEPWTPPVNLGPAINSPQSEFFPFLTADGRTLIFASGRTGGLGSTDLYLTTRAVKLTLTADDQSRLFGHANPPLSYELSGFVGGEPASVVSGTTSCSTTATASSPAGDYPITCTAGSLSAPGYVFETFVAGTLTVAYSTPCSTGPSSGPLQVASGEALCVGGAHTGPVTVAPGGALDIEDGRITGPVVANGATAVRICGASITGPLTVSGSTGPVVVGGEDCAPNTIVGPVRVTDNTGGVEVSGNRVIGPLRVTGNAAPVHAAGNTVTGPVVIQP